jgi:uncharacterized membrane-anchored protein YhcB (DUF1043 family)
MELSVIFSLVAVAAGGVGVWVKLNSEITKQKTRTDYLEQELREHKSNSGNAIDSLKHEMTKRLDDLTKEVHELAKTLASLIGEIKNMEKQR